MSASKRARNSEPREMVRYPEYHDHIGRDDAWVELQRSVRGVEASEKTTGATKKFPTQLHQMLTAVEATSQASIVSWLPHGRAFKVYDKKQFTEQVLPRFFRFQADFASFQRQLNIYGFRRLTRLGTDRKAYYHELFLRGRPKMATLIPRPMAGAHSVRRKYDPSTEPDFHAMEPLSGYSSPAQPTSPIPPPETSAPVARLPPRLKTRGLSLSDYETPASFQQNDPHCSDEIDLAALIASSVASLDHLSDTIREASPSTKQASTVSSFHQGYFATEQAFSLTVQQANVPTVETAPRAANPAAVGSIASSSDSQARRSTGRDSHQRPTTDMPRRSKRRRNGSAAQNVSEHDVDETGRERDHGDKTTSSESESPAKLAVWADFLGAVDLDSSSESNT